MAIENKEARTIRPTHPGEILEGDFLPDDGLTTGGVAEIEKIKPLRAA